VRRRQPAGPEGRGDATITADGCPVEVYAALPPAGEAELVHAAVVTRGSVLELGCGTGRIAEGLAALGHGVVGVDASAEMLAHLRRATPVHTAIETLALPERFDAVLLASTLVNTHDAAQRAAFLRTAARHLAPDGVVIVQRHPPTWADEVAPHRWWAGPVELELRDVVRHSRTVVSATVVHRLGTIVAEQDFTTEVLDDDALAAALGRAGLHPQQTLTPDGAWVTAVVDGAEVR
jgi:SAM-dependent methyltransferase